MGSPVLFVWLISLEISQWNNHHHTHCSCIRVTENKPWAEIKFWHRQRKCSKENHSCVSFLTLNYLLNSYLYLSCFVFVQHLNNPSTFSFYTLISDLHKTSWFSAHIYMCWKIAAKILQNVVHYSPPLDMRPYFILYHRISQKWKTKCLYIFKMIIFKAIRI